MKRVLYFFMIVTVVAGCVDPIKLSIPGGGLLVVDGVISNEPGPYTVSLSRSIDFDNSRPVRVYSNPEPGATIVISDNTGFSETLVEFQPGLYRTKNIQGKVGNTYQLSIVTKDGKKYRSTPDTMPDVTPVKSIEFQFAVYDRFIINANGQPRVVKQEGFYIYAVAADPPGVPNYYRWSADGIYEFFTSTTNPDINHCWMHVDRLEDQLQLSDDLVYDGQSIKQFICIIPYDKPWRYLIKMRQQSLSEQAYSYWKVSRNQQSSTGSIFDPPPSIIEGNVTNEDDPNETVLGFFGASAYTRMNYVLNRLKDSGFLAPNPAVQIVAADCRAFIPGSTNIRPEEFPE